MDLETLRLQFRDFCEAIQAENKLLIFDEAIDKLPADRILYYTKRLYFKYVYGQGTEKPVSERISLLFELMVDAVGMNKKISKGWIY